MTVYATITVGEETRRATRDVALVPGGQERPAVRADWLHAPDRFAGVARRAAVAGELTEFDIESTRAVRRRVWRALEDIPTGTSTTYWSPSASGGPRRAPSAP